MTTLPHLSTFQLAVPHVSNFDLLEYQRVITDEISNRLMRSRRISPSPTLSDEAKAPEIRESDQPETAPLTTLPWTNFDELPSTSNILLFLVRYQPVKTDEANVGSQIKMLLESVNRATISEEKAVIVDHMFRLLMVNTWFLDEHAKFRETVRLKIIEFETDGLTRGNELARKFAWLKEWPYKLFKCAYCAEICDGSIVDGDDTNTHFCSDEHSHLYSLNGDCAHDPSITKEQLDRDLEEYFSNADLITAEKLLEQLDDERADYYPYWIQVGWILYSISKGHEKGLELWINFSRRSNKFKDQVCEKEWDKMVVKNFTLDTLKHFARNDSPSIVLNAANNRIPILRSRLPEPLDSLLSSGTVPVHFYTRLQRDFSRWAETTFPRELSKFLKISPAQVSCTSFFGPDDVLVLTASLPSQFITTLGQWVGRFLSEPSIKVYNIVNVSDSDSDSVLEAVFDSDARIGGR